MFEELLLRVGRDDAPQKDIRSWIRFLWTTIANMATIAVEYSPLEDTKELAGTAYVTYCSGCSNSKCLLRQRK
ncbi:4705_t:CDS:2 [Paraglomus brasilianum]|uniref:4705_t:CDS:1 n=1 Tax=Paraglomus brasilianum TaxID=144538 RepID=A0A9N9C4N3_9GLOM|nr:4705_t:CDS:2 [Paraglomus brasilianum]